LSARVGPGEGSEGIVSVDMVLMTLVLGFPWQSECGSG
jgi:hypothetical protein